MARLGRRRRWAVVHLALLLTACTGSPAAPTGAGTVPAPEDSQPAVVVRVVDGDTLILRGSGTGPLSGRPTRVRVIGMDTPEVGKRPECYGPQATARTSELVPVGARIRVAADRDPLDRYRRSLLHVWTSEGGLLSEALVRDGYAEALLVPPNDRYATVIESAERAASRSGEGLWSACRGRRDAAPGA